MILKTAIIISLLMHCECVYVYSSFWAPALDPRILNYRVDASFDDRSGKNARNGYEQQYGFRGERLIADLGNGKGPGDAATKDKAYGDVKFYYTYSGATNNQVQ